MIKDDKFGLKGFELVEVERAGHAGPGRARDRAATRTIVFLGWEPHPMNTKFKMTYLTGGDDVFGPNYRRRHGLHQRPHGLSATECPNVGKLISRT